MYLKLLFGYLFEFKQIFFKHVFNKCYWVLAKCQVLFWHLGYILNRTNRLSLHGAFSLNVGDNKNKHKKQVNYVEC